MRSDKYIISRLRHRAVFGTTKSEPANTATGRIHVFVPKFEVYYGDYTQTLNQQISLNGLYKEYVRVIVVRHDPRVVSSNENVISKVQLNDGEYYQVVAVTVDDSINGYDIVTLKRTKGISPMS